MVVKQNLKSKAVFELDNVLMLGAMCSTSAIL